MVLVLVLGVGLLATGCVIQGCALTVRETRLALLNLREERDLLANRSHPRHVDCSVK
jgi:hypothetical protein